MPTHKSAEKRLRTSGKRKVRNMAQKSAARTAVKRVHQAHDKGAAHKALLTATSLLDRLARKGVIHQNKAARQKSRLSRKVNTLEG